MKEIIDLINRKIDLIDKNSSLYGSDKKIFLCGMKYLKLEIEKYMEEERKEYTYSEIGVCNGRSCDECDDLDWCIGNV